MIAEVISFLFTLWVLSHLVKYTLKAVKSGIRAISKPKRLTADDYVLQAASKSSPWLVGKGNISKVKTQNSRHKLTPSTLNMVSTSSSNVSKSTVYNPAVSQHSSKNVVLHPRYSAHLKSSEANVKSNTPWKSDTQQKSRSTAKNTDRFCWTDISCLSFKHFQVKSLEQFSGFASIKDIGMASLPQNEREQDRYLPHIKETLTPISIDNQTFNTNKVFAKPDAVFYDHLENTFYVVEFKSRPYKGMTSLYPENVMQLIISAIIINTLLKRGEFNLANGKQPKVKCVFRLENHVAEIEGWEALESHIMELAEDLIAAQTSVESLSSSELAQHFVLFDTVFKRDTKDKELKRVQGQLKHYRMAKHVSGEAS